MTVSVFICTYNRGNLIDGTLCAVIERQTRKPDEIVVVNGGGTNDCHATIVKWQKLFPTLREIKTKNVNLATSRNIGLPQCKGDIILQTDDDAEPFPNWIERLIDEHQKHPEAGVIGGNVVDASGKGLIFKIADATTFTHFNEENYCETRTVPGVNSSYKRDTIEKVGGMIPKCSEEKMWIIIGVASKQATRFFHFLTLRFIITIALHGEDFITSSTCMDVLTCWYGENGKICIVAIRMAYTICAILLSSAISV